MASSRSSVLSPARPSLLGKEQPRIFTPPLRVLTPKTSLGFAFIDFATDVVGIDLLPWQRWLAVHALELLPDGTPRFRTVLLLVARQNGKSTFLQLLALFFLYVRGVRLVIGTAQNLDIAEEVWQGAVDIAQDVPELASEVEDVVMVNGKKTLVLSEGERYKVQAATRRGGRGLSGDLVMLDELREHKKWDAWGAITKTTMARALAMIWGVSNAGDAESVVLAFLRWLAHHELGNPDDLAPIVGAEGSDDLDDDSLGVFEWSAPPGCALDDPAGWAQANPSLGHTITERAIRAALRTDPEAVFRTEVLCQWVDTTEDVSALHASWPALFDTTDDRTTPVSYGVAVSPDRDWSAIVMAWTRPDGVKRLALVDYRPSTEWIAARLEHARQTWPGPVCLSTSAKGLVPDGEEPSQSQQAQAHTALDDAVRAGTVLHSNEAALNTAVRNFRWRSYGDSRMFDRKGHVDISPLDAAALALHGLTTDAATPPNLW